MPEYLEYVELSLLTDNTVVDGAVVTNLFPNPSVETDLTGHTAGTNATIARSTAWAAVGANSLAITVTANGSDDTFASVGGDAGAVRLGMGLGKTYTVSGTVNTPTAQTGILSARARTITVHTKSPTVNGGNYVITTSPQGPATGTGRVSATFTVPADATEAFIRLYNGSGVAGEVVRWDALMLTEGSTLLDYFDGSTIDTTSYRYDWSGTANNSTSTRTELIQSGTMVLLPEFQNLEFDVKYNDLGVIQFTYPLDKAKTLGLGDQSIIAVRVGFSDDTTADIERYIIEATDEDKVVDGVRMKTLTGRSSLAILHDAKVYPSNWPVVDPSGHEFVDMSVGNILKTLVTRAQARGTITDISHASFTGTLDSFGATWSALHTQNYATGTDYFDLLNEFMTRGYVDAWVDSSWSLRLVNGGTRGVHRDAGTVEIRPAQNVSDMTTTTNSEESATTVLIEGEEGTAIERHRAAFATTLGRRRERYVQQGGIADAGVLTLLGDAELDLYARIPSEETVGIVNSGLLPFKDFQIADWVWVRYDSDQAPVERRVRQLAITVNESREVSLAVVLNSILFEKDIALQRKMEAYVGNGGTYGAIANPVQDNTIPNPPTTVGITSGFFVSSAGQYSGAMTVSWTAPTTNTDGRTISDLKGYEIQWQYDGDTQWSGNFPNETTAWQYSPVTPGRVVRARVRAVDEVGHVSTWATSADHTVATDTVAPPVPSNPIATNGVDQIKVRWDGLTSTGSNVWPFDLKAIEVWMSPSTGFTPGVGDAQLIGTFQRGGGEMLTQGLLVDQPAYFKLRSIDYAGNVSAASGQAVAERDPIPGQDPPPTTVPPVPVFQSILGDAQGLTVLMEPIDDQWTTLTYYVNGLAVISNTTATVVWISRDGNGSALQQEVGYSITVVATNNVGPSAATDPMVSSLDPGVSPEQTIAKLNTAFLRAGTIKVGNITISAPTSDDPLAGIKILLTDGGLIHFPANGAEAVITAALTASEVTVRDFMRIMGTTNSIEGSLELRGAVTPPSTQPSVVTYPCAVAKSTAISESVSEFQGLGGDATYVYTLDPNNKRIVRMNRSTGAVTFHPITGLPADYEYTVSYGGFDGTYHYILSTGWFASGDRVQVNRINTAFAYVSRTALIKPTDHDTGGDLNGLDFTLHVPGDGFFYLAWGMNTNYNWRVQRYTTAGASSTQVLKTANGWANYAPVSFNVGNFDFGATRYVFIAAANNPQVYVFAGGNPAARQTANEWTTDSQIAGTWWDATEGRFYSLSHPGGVVRLLKHSKTVTATSRSSKYTWYDSDPAGAGTAESTASPTATATVPTRGVFVIQTGKPPDAGDPDDPNKVRIYIANQLQTPEMADGATSLTVVDPVTGGVDAPTTNGFASRQPVNPGLLISEALRQDGKPKISLDGVGKANVDGLLPPGSITMWVTSTAPEGWVLCQGQDLSKTQFPDLFAAVGTTFGTPADTTKFRVPDFRDRFPIGASGTKALGATGGAATKLAPPHTHATPNHTHTDNFATGGPSSTYNRGTGTNPVASDFHTHTVTGGITSSGSGTTGDTIVPAEGFDVMNPWLSINFIIKT